MGEFEGISASLQRQRKDIDDSIESTSSRVNQASDLIGKIEDLRRRAEATQKQQAPGTKRQ